VTADARRRWSPNGCRFNRRFLVGDCHIPECICCMARPIVLWPETDVAIWVATFVIVAERVALKALRFPLNQTLTLIRLHFSLAQMRPPSEGIHGGRGSSTVEPRSVTPGAYAPRAHLPSCSMLPELWRNHAVCALPRKNWRLAGIADV
jgi:hypothetical protein